MNKQNPKKLDLDCMNNIDLRSNRNEKSRQKIRSQGPQPTVTHGVMNKFGFKYGANRGTNKENKQPFAEESKMKLQKKNNLLKRPTFKVGIPHHKYWSPTARDTPISHFHGLNKGCKSRQTFLKRLSKLSITENVDQERPNTCINKNYLKQKEIKQEVLKEENSTDEPEKKNTDVMEDNTLNVACADLNDLKQEEATQEILKEENPNDELEIKDTDVMENNTSNIDSLNPNDLKNLENFLKIIIIIILYNYILPFLK